MRDWSSGQILRTVIADAYRSRMGGANPICIDWFEIFMRAPDDPRPWVNK